MDHTPPDFEIILNTTNSWRNSTIVLKYQSCLISSDWMESYILKLKCLCLCPSQTMQFSVNSADFWQLVTHSDCKLGQKSKMKKLCSIFQPLHQCNPADVKGKKRSQKLYASY